MQMRKNGEVIRVLARFGLVALLAAWTGWAGEIIVHLKNDDRVTGIIVSESATELTLQSGLLGKVTIPIGEISRREDLKTNAPPTVASSTAAASSGTNAVTAAATTATNATAVVSAPATNKPPAVVAAKPPPPPKVKHWNTEIQFGLNLRYGAAKQEEALVVAKSTYGRGKFREILDYNFAYGESGGVLSANRMNGSAKSEYDLTDRVYLFGLAGASYDEVRLIDRQYELNPGVGYQWIKQTNFVFKTEVGFGYQDQFFHDHNEIESFSGRLGLIYTWKIWDKLMADGKLEYFPNVKAIDQYRVRFENTVRYPLLKNISLNLIVIDLYDTQVPATVENNDLQVRTAIGMKF